MTDFWAEQWRLGKIRFHEGKPNAYLTKFLERLAGRRRVLVPLCGKAVDLAFLAAHGHEVIGVELVEDAVVAFFAEHRLAPAITRRGALVEYAAGPITIFAGDVFAVTREETGRLDAVYDRAALVALPEDVRPRYVDHVRMLAAPGLHALAVTLAYDQAGMTGPPFSVPPDELARLYDGCTLELLAEAADTTRAVPMIERCYLITGSSSRTSTS